MLQDYRSLLHDIVASLADPGAVERATAVPKGARPPFLRVTTGHCLWRHGSLTQNASAR